MISRFLFLLFVLLNILTCNAQSLSMEELSNAVITAIAKDQFGRTWFGTSNGLYSYDGYDVYKINSKTPTCQISNDLITGLAFNQRTKKLVVTTYHGINFFDTDSLRNTILFVDAKSSVKGANHIFDPHIDSLGNVWCANAVGKLIKVSPALKISVHAISVPVPLNLVAKYNYKDLIGEITTHGDRVYFTTQCLMCSFDEKSSSARTESFDHRAISGIYVTDSKQLICDFNGIHLKKSGDSVDIAFKPVHLINSSFKDVDGDIWILLNRTQLYKLGSNLELQLVYELDVEMINKHKAITVIHVGKRRIWLGTQRGFIMINKPITAFRKLFENLNGYSPLELSSRGIIKRNDTSIICAGYNYLASYNPLTGSSNTIVPKETARSLIPYGLEITGDSLWIASEGTGLRLIDLSSRQIKSITYRNKVPHEYFVYGGLIKCVKKIDSVLFLCEYGLMGAYHLNSKLIMDCDVFKWRYPWFNDKARGVNQLLELSEDELVFVVQGNVVISNRKFKVKDVIRLSDQKKENVVPVTIVNVMKAKDKKLWLSTLNEGICCYDREKRTAKWFNTSNGLSDNTVYNSLQSDDGRIWVATNYGLSVIDQNSGKIKCYFEKDGLANDEFNTNSFYKDKTGDLYFGGMKGFTRVIPSLLTPQGEKESLLLTAVEFAGKGSSDSVVISNLRAIGPLNLPYDSRYLRVRFSPMNFSSKNRYHYRLLGMDSNWVSLGSNNFVVFNSIIPGSYTLEIKAWSEGGDVLPGYLKIPIISEQVFYKRFWFILFSILVVVILIGLIFYSIYKLKIRAINQMAEMRLRIATDLHDQVGGLLNKTATQAEMVQMKLEGKDESLSKISDNSRVALNSMRDILWNLDPRNDTPESLIDRMSEYAHKMMEDTNTYELDLVQLKNAKLSNEVRQTIVTVFKESITNIVKHANGEKVKVSVESNDMQLVVKVHCSGIFKEKEGHTGQGIRNMKMRMEKVGGTFELVKTDGVTTIFSAPVKSK